MNPFFVIKINNIKLEDKDMPPWAFALIIIGSVLLVEIVVFAIIHRHLLRSLFKGGPRMKAPSWHFWIPKKHRVQ